MNYCDCERAEIGSDRRCDCERDQVIAATQMPPQLRALLRRIFEAGVAQGLDKAVSEDFGGVSRFTQDEAFERALRAEAEHG